MNTDTSSVRVGAKFRKAAARGFPTILWHVRAIVDGDQVVIRAWSRKRRMWVYRIEWIGSVVEWIQGEGEG